MSGHQAHQARVYAGGDDHHAPAAITDPANRSPARYREPPDEIELACPGCTLIWDQGSWHHDHACIFARRAVREPG